MQGVSIDELCPLTVLRLCLVYTHSQARAILAIKNRFLERDSRFYLRMRLPRLLGVAAATCRFKWEEIVPRQGTRQGCQQIKLRCGCNWLGIIRASTKYIFRIPHAAMLIERKVSVIRNPAILRFLCFCFYYSFFFS